MTAYVLIIAIYWGGTSVTTQEFTSLERCEMAAHQIMDAAGGGGIVATCALK